MTTLKLLVPNDSALKQIKALAKDLGATVAEDNNEMPDSASKITQAVSFWQNHQKDFSDFKFNRNEANER